MFFIKLLSLDKVLLFQKPGVHLERQWPHLSHQVLQSVLEQTGDNKDGALSVILSRYAHHILLLQWCILTLLPFLSLYTQATSLDDRLWPS